MKSGKHKNGTERGGATFDKTSLLRLLRNPIYAGLVRCSGHLTKGAHEAIVDQGTWGRVERCLTRNGSAGYQGERESSDALLKGLLYCAQCGCRMTPSYTTKGNRRFRYYVCQTRLKKGAHACPTGRVAAHVVENQVVEQIRAIKRDPKLIAETVRLARAQREQLLVRLEAEAKTLRRELRGKRAALKRLATRGGDAAESVGARERAEVLERRLDAIAREMEVAKRATVTEQDVRSALEAFEPVWDVLWPAERAGALSLLVNEITMAGAGSEIVVSFRGPGTGPLACASLPK